MFILLSTLQVAILIHCVASIATWRQGDVVGVPSTKAIDRPYRGVCIDASTLNNAAYVGKLKSDYDLISPSNALKWDATEPTRGSFTFSAADFLLNWASSNGKMVRGRSLVWHSQLPSWVSAITTPAALTSVIQSHVSTVAGRYKGKILGNLFRFERVMFAHLTKQLEVLNEDGSLRSSIFYNVLGEAFITVAFKAARAADPSAKLYINDYNLDQVNAKVKGLVTLVTHINSGTTKYIDGIGSDLHLVAGGAGGVQGALTALASAPVSEIAITALSIKGAIANGSDYTTVTRACLTIPSCVGITLCDDPNAWQPFETSV